MALEMKGTCERCDAMLSMDAPARICSYECTFCTTCGDEMNNVCPNCGGELVERPTRVTTA
jgi:hypothetical protein